MLRKRVVEHRVDVEKLLKDKKKFGRKTTEYNEEDDDLLFEEESGLIKKSTFKVLKILISFDCATGNDVDKKKFYPEIIVKIWECGGNAHTVRYTIVFVCFIRKLFVYSFAKTPKILNTILK